MIDPSGHKAEPYYLNHVWYDIYGHARMDNPKHPNFVYDCDPWEKEQSIKNGGAERGTPRTIRSPDERVSTIKKRLDEKAGGHYYSPDEFFTDIIVDGTTFVAAVFTAVPQTRLVGALLDSILGTTKVSGVISERIHEFNDSQKIFEE